MELLNNSVVQRLLQDFPKFFFRFEKIDQGALFVNRHRCFNVLVYHDKVQVVKSSKREVQIYPVSRR